jgi:NADH dehydrogenase
MARILILGGGFGGFYTALHLERVLRRTDHQITLVSNENYLLYTPLLPEAAAGAIEPRHVVVPLRSVLRRTRVNVAEVQYIDVVDHSVVVRTSAGEEQSLDYDHLVLALGSVPRFDDSIPGVREHAVGFKTLAEAIYLRNHVLQQLELAEATSDEKGRRASLTFVFVGGGYAGIEAAGELFGLARSALRFYPRLRKEEMKWMVVEAAQTILSDFGSEIAAYAMRRLAGKGIEVRLMTTLKEARHDAVVLSTGEVVSTRTLVWTAGVTAHPLAAEIPAAKDRHGRLVTTPSLEVPGLPGVWALGDIAAVPDEKSGGQPAPPTAQHALQQARLLGRNVVAALAGRPRTAFAFGTRGMLVTLGDRDGAGRLLGLPVRGLLAWWMTRTYHLFQLPTLARKARVAFDWTIALCFPRDIAQLGSLAHIRRDRSPADANQPVDQKTSPRLGQ